MLNVINYLTNFKWWNLQDYTSTLPNFLSLNDKLLYNVLLKIKEQRPQYPTTILFDHLIINSVRNVFDSLIEIIKNFNIFIIAESKLGASFPKN